MASQFQHPKNGMPPGMAQKRRTLIRANSIKKREASERSATAEPTYKWTIVTNDVNIMFLSMDICILDLKREATAKPVGRKKYCDYPFSSRFITRQFLRAFKYLSGFIDVI